MRWGGIAMAKKKDLTPLDLDLIQCAKDGYGCDYGRWHADKKEVKLAAKPKIEPDPGVKRICENCGKVFYRDDNRPCKFCCDKCRRQAEYRAVKARMENKGAVQMDNRRRKQAKSKEDTKFRVLAIYEYLNEGKKITEKEIRRRLLDQYDIDADKKTILNDISSISKFIPIITTPGRNGGHQKVDVLREAEDG
jgi:hypothetical protein